MYTCITIYILICTCTYSVLVHIHDIYNTNCINSKDISSSTRNRVRNRLVIRSLMFSCSSFVHFECKFGGSDGLSCMNHTNRTVRFHSACACRDCGDHGGHYASLAQKTSHNNLYRISRGIQWNQWCTGAMRSGVYTHSYIMPLRPPLGDSAVRLHGTEIL